MLNIFEFSFAIRGLLVAFTLGAVIPMLGVLLVMRRLSLVVDTISHVALAGVSVGLALGIYPIWTGIGIGGVSAVFIEEVRLRSKLPGEVVLAIFLYGSLGLSFAIFSISPQSGGSSALVEYLFGNLFSVSWADFFIVASVMGVVLVAVLATFRSISLIVLSPDLAHVNGLKVVWLLRLLALLTGISVAVGILAVGVLMMGVLLVLPALVALRTQKGVLKTLIVASLLGVVTSVGGTFFAYYSNLPTSSAIASIGIGIVLVAELFRMFKNKKRSNSNEL